MNKNTLKLKILPSILFKTLPFILILLFSSGCRKETDTLELKFFDKITNSSGDLEGWDILSGSAASGFTTQAITFAKEHRIYCYNKKSQNKFMIVEY